MKKPIPFLLSLLNIRKEESTTVAFFFLHHFFLGLGIALFFTAAGTLFLEHFKTADYFPYIYMISAVILMVLGRIYSHYEHKYSIKELLPKVLIFLILLSLTFQGIFLFSKDDIFYALLIIFFRVVYLLSNLEFWGLSALVFDVRQGKRLFGLISSGDVPAKLLGYLSVKFLVPMIRLESLVTLSAIAFFIAYLFLKQTLRKVKIRESEAHEAHNAHDDRNMLLRFFGNRFILNLSILGFLIFASYVLIEFSFLSNVQSRYKTQEELKNYLSTFFAIGYSFNIITKLIFSGRLMNAIGVRTSLLLMPLTLLAFSFFFLIYGSADNTSQSNLIFIGVMTMSIGVVRSAINEPTFLMMFQPLPVYMRLHGHTVIKGFVQPLALAFIGFVLWISFQLRGDAYFYYLNFGLFALIFVWIFIVYRSHKNYIAVLNDAIKKRFITGAELAITDKTYFKIVAEKLNSSYPEEVIFAINALEKTDINLLKHKIPVLIKHTDESVLRKTISLIHQNKWDDFSKNLYDLLDKTDNPDLKTDIIKAYCALDENASNKLSRFFETDDFNLKKALYIGLINSDDLQGRIKAEQALMLLVGSHNKQERIMACHIIAELKNPAFVKPIIALLNDKNDSVVPEAIEAAGKMQNDKLIAPLFNMVKNNRFKKYAIQSLCGQGKNTIDEILEDNVEVLSHFIPDLIKISEKTGGKSAEKFLITQCQNTPVHVRGKAVSALNALQYQANKEEKKVFKKLTDKEFALACALLHAANDKSTSPRLKACLDYELQLCTTRIFHLCRLMYDADMVKKAEAASHLAEKEKRANALEILDNIIPKKLYKNIAALIDNEPIEVKLAQLAKYTPSVVADISRFIIQNGHKRFTDWTICVALQEHPISADSIDLYMPYLSDKNQLLKQSATEALHNFRQKNPQEFNTIIEKQHLNIHLEMSAHHDNRLSDLEKVIVLKSTQLFADTPENIVAEIVPIVKEIPVAGNDIVFKKGDSGNSMYVIYEGAVNIHDGDSLFATLNSRDFFGELALLDPEPRSATATATTNTLLLKIDEDEWYDLMEDRPEVLRSMMRILCRRIRNQNDLLTRTHNL